MTTRITIDPAGHDLVVEFLENGVTTSVAYAGTSGRVDFHIWEGRSVTIREGVIESAANAGPAQVDPPAPPAPVEGVS